MLQMLIQRAIGGYCFDSYWSPIRNRAVGIPLQAPNPKTPLVTSTLISEISADPNIFHVSPHPCPADHSRHLVISASKGDDGY